MAHGAKKHSVFKQLNPKGTYHADSSLARWNTDPADYPDYAIAPLKVEGTNKKTPHDTMVLGTYSARGDRSPIAR
jgi:hypothetical protein